MTRFSDLHFSVGLSLLRSDYLDVNFGFDSSVARYHQRRSNFTRYSSRGFFELRLMHAVKYDLLCHDRINAYSVFSLLKS